MLGRVLAGRLVAAADMTAFEAEPQMDPPSAGLETFLAALRRARLDMPDLMKMSAACCHVGLPRMIVAPRGAIIASIAAIRDRVMEAACR